MDLTYSPAERTFQRALRTWLKRNIPKRQRDERPMEWGDPRRLARAKAWQRKAHGAGYLALAGPAGQGGGGSAALGQPIVLAGAGPARAPGPGGVKGGRRGGFG